MEVKGTRNPPVDLLYHFFTETQVKADPAVAKALAESEENDFGYEYTLDVEVSKIPEEEHLYQVHLTIETREKSGCFKGYDVKLVVVGSLAVDAKATEKQHGSLAAVFGATMLYSAAREFLYSITLRGPFPPIYLPTRSFIPEEMPATKSQKTKTPTKTKSGNKTVPKS